MKRKTIRLTESELRRIIKSSISNVLSEGWDYQGRVSNDGNYMVGGTYGWRDVTSEKDILEDLLEEIDIDEDKFSMFEEYCNKNPNIFIIAATINISYDESTGYGSADWPIYSIESIDGVDEINEYLLRYQDADVANLAVETVNSIVDRLDVSDFDLDE